MRTTYKFLKVKEDTVVNLDQVAYFKKDGDKTIRLYLSVKEFLEVEAINTEERDKIFHALTNDIQ